MKAKRHITCVLAFLTAVMSGTLSCDSNDDDLKVDISFDKNLISLVVGDSETITATITPSGVPASGLEWISGNEDVLTVSGGVITTLSPGRTSVLARMGMNSAYCDVIVTAVPVDVTSVALNKTELSIPVGHVETLRAIIEPEEATDKKIEWTTSDQSVVSVTEDGQIKALSLGDAVVTVTTRNGGLTAHCAVSVIPSITLMSPVQDQAITLDAGRRDARLDFSWECDVAEVDDFIFMVNTTTDFTTPALSQNLTATTISVSQYDLNEIARGEAGEQVPLYWTVKPQTNPEAAFTSAGRMIITPDRNEYLLLDEPTATGMTLTKLEAPYDYRITGTGTASVRTVDLTEEVRGDKLVISFRYTGNRDLNGFTVNLVRGGAPVKSVQKDLPAAAVMTEHRLLLDELPDNWGQAGDCLELDFGNAAGYVMEIDALHFTDVNSSEYVPAIWTISGLNNSTVLSGGAGFTYVSLRVNPVEHATNPNYADPSVMFASMACRLPSNATILKFEYKTSHTATARVRMFIWGEHMGSGPIAAYGISVSNNLPQPTSEWTEYSMDFTDLRREWGWGDYFGNWSFRWDPSDVRQYEIEVRNFRIEMKE